MQPAPTRVPAQSIQSYNPDVTVIAPTTSNRAPESAAITPYAPAPPPKFVYQGPPPLLAAGVSTPRGFGPAPAPLTHAPPVTAVGAAEVLIPARGSSKTVEEDILNLESMPNVAVLGARPFSFVPSVVDESSLGESGMRPFSWVESATAESTNADAPHSPITVNSDLAVIMTTIPFPSLTTITQPLAKGLTYESPAAPSPGANLPQGELNASMATVLPKTAESPIVSPPATSIPPLAVPTTLPGHIATTNPDFSKERPTQGKSWGVFSVLKAGLTKPLSKPAKVAPSPPEVTTSTAAENSSTAVPTPESNTANGTGSPAQSVLPPPNIISPVEIPASPQQTTKVAPVAPSARVEQPAEEEPSALVSAQSPAPLASEMPPLPPNLASSTPVQPDAVEERSSAETVIVTPASVPSMPVAGNTDLPPPPPPKDDSDTAPDAARLSVPVTVERSASVTSEAMLFERLMKIPAPEDAEDEFEAPELTIKRQAAKEAAKEADRGSSTVLFERLMMIPAPEDAGDEFEAPDLTIKRAPKDLAIAEVTVESIPAAAPGKGTGGKVGRIFGKLMGFR
ncbi:hypothetical protein HK101_001570 [Irineochytrium annulatum]|nr:hypothetical protein HK101_001570 [Irineochytrium annulatum]